MKKKNVILLDEYDRYVFDKYYDESFQKIKEVCDIHDINSDVSKIVKKDNCLKSGIIYAPSLVEEKYYELHLIDKYIENEINLLKLYGRYFNFKSIDVKFCDKRENTFRQSIKEAIDGIANTLSINASTQSKYSSTESFKKSLEEKYRYSGDKRYTIEEARLKLEEDKIDYEKHIYLKKFVYGSNLEKLSLSFEYHKSIIDSTTNSLKASNFNIPIFEGLKKQIEIISNKSTSQIINSAQSIEINIEYFD